jgi:cysteine desulfurase family protein
MAIYLDNAATSFPKPESVPAAVADVLRRGVGNPGRGAHRLSLEAGRLILDVRLAVADLFGIGDPARVVFTGSATEALNLALFGLLEAGDRVVTTSMEHNAVTRPLRALQEQGVTVVKVQADPAGFVPPVAIQAACAMPTRMVVLNHCSNVTGTLQALEEIGPWCRRQGILVLVDAAQSAGWFPFRVEPCGIDLLAAPGHKGLLGPPGTGFLYVREGLSPRPLIFGGTGGNSQSELPPELLPDRFEAGTLNTPGLAGLKAGIDFLQAEGLATVRAHETRLAEGLLAGLLEVPGVTVYGPHDPAARGSVVSFNLVDRDPAEIGFLLDRDHEVLTRVGLHCSPDAHRTIGTFPRGTVRVSPGYFNTEEEIDHLLRAVSALAAHPGG